MKVMEAEQQMKVMKADQQIKVTEAGALYALSINILEQNLGVLHTRLLFTPLKTGKANADLASDVRNSMKIFGMNLLALNNSENKYCCK